jgi:hypothetical protein
MKFRQNLAVKILSVMAAISVLASCGSAPSKVSSKNNSSLPRTATGDDPQKFGAKYSGRTYQQAILSPVASVENKGAVVNQGDFLTQLTNVRDYSNSLTNRFAANYGKITNWVLAGANVNELAQYGTDDKTEGGNLTCVEGDLHGICRVSNSARSGNRKGNRNEFNAGFKFEYSPTDWLLLTAGVKYTHYKSKDRGLQEKIANLKQEEVLTESRIPFIVKKLKQVSPELTQNYLNYERKSKLYTKLYNEFEELYPKPDYDSSEFEQWVNNQSNYIYAHGYTESTEEENGIF